MQAHLQYHPSSAQSQYPANGIHHDSAPQRSESRNSYSSGADMNPYQQYGGGNPYQGQPPPNPYQQQQQPQHAQHPHHQQSYMQNQLPPLVPGMPPPPMPGIPPVREDHNSYPPSSANSSQSMQGHYMPAPSQPMLQPPQPQGPPQPQQSLPPPSRPAESKPPQEKKMSNSMVRDGLRYSLEVVQQPQRARMCGFGDKDRRPITPPPCVRLVIVDDQTGREIDVNDIASDPSFFILQVDLWAESADREANVVRASSSSPAVSISSATTTSYPPPQETPRHAEAQPIMYMDHNGTPIYANMPGYAVQLGRPSIMPQYGGGYMYPQMHGPAMAFQQPPSTSASSAMYTRNLIGSLTVNAARLTDNENKAGYWFVLQDLSVRTEGFFRLRMTFIDISNHGAPGITPG